MRDSRPPAALRPRLLASWLLLLLLAGCGSTRSEIDSAADADSAVDAASSEVAADHDLLSGDTPTEACQAQCGERKCGPDGCGGSCGSCAESLACDEPSGSCKKTAVASVPMRDGAELWTKVFLPDQVPAGSSGVKAIVLRTPYRRSHPDLPAYYDAQGEFYRQRGYGFVLQDCRASFNEVGAFYSYDAEIDDGKDALDWVVSQSWAAPEVATIGSSYDAYTALAAAVDNPAVKVVVADGPTAGISHYFKGGIPLVSILQVIHTWNSGADPVDYDAIIAPATNALHLVDLDVELAKTSSSTWKDLLALPWPDDPPWDAYHLRGPALSKICAPVLITHSHAEVWNDPLNIVKALWRDGCAEHVDDVRYFLGHQGHGEALSSIPYGGSLFVSQLAIDYIDQFLGGKPLGVSSRPRVMFESPEDTTPREAESWPPSTSSLLLLLANDTDDPLVGRLSITAASGEAQTAIVVDPETQDPCDASAPWPTMMFASAPLSNAVYVAGVPQLQLRFSASAPDADLFVSLMHFNPGNPTAAPVFISYGYERARYRRALAAPEQLAPDEVIDWALDLMPATQQVPAGHSLLLLINGSYCNNIENPHTGEPLDKQTTRKAATLRVFHSATEQSSLAIPVITP